MRRLNEKLGRIEAAKRGIEEVEQIRSVTEHSLKDLVFRAGQGQQIAALALVTIVTTAVDDLNSLAEQQPEMFLPVSRKMPGWPAIISRKRADTLRNKGSLVRLEVGNQSIYSQRQWQPSAPTTRVATNVLDLARKMERDGQLPPLTKDTKRGWFEAAWKRALWAGWKPEDDNRLHGISKSKAKKKPKYCKVLHPATRRSNLRAALKAQVWKAFDQVVATG